MRLLGKSVRRGGRVAEGARLESVFTGNRNVGSNPTPSAKFSDRLFRCAWPLRRGYPVRRVDRSSVASTESKSVAPLIVRHPLNMFRKDAVRFSSLTLR